VLLAIGCRALSIPGSLVPTATSQPTMTPIPGWKKFEATGMEIWLPDSYVGGDLNQDMDLLVEELRSLGPEYEPFAQQLEQNPSLYTLWAYDSDVGGTAFLSNVGIVNERVISVIDIDTYIDQFLKQMPSQIRVEERQVTTINNDDARRLIVMLPLSDFSVQEAIYVVKHNNTIWVIAFACAQKDFNSRFSVFEQSAHTFSTQP
jgi:hypothetical protein